MNYYIDKGKRLVLEEYDSYNGLHIENRELTTSSMKHAILVDCIFKNCDFSKSEMFDVRFVECDLEGSIFHDADIRNARFARTNLKNCKMDLEIEDGLLKRIAEKVVLNDDCFLNMDSWHTCDTVHCIAGWATYFSDKGDGLESEYGTEVAALKLLGTEAHSHFYDDKEDALKYLESLL